MGSITKKPKAPAITYVVRNEPVSATASTPATPAPVEPEKTDSQIKAESRTDSLLCRSRGRFGTIATSFRGFLDSANNQQSQPKTLLGE